MFSNEHLTDFNTFFALTEDEINLSKSSRSHYRSRSACKAQNIVFRPKQN